MTKVIQGERDPALSATIIERRALWYSEGADTDRDRPAHVRAGSSLGMVGDRIVVVQDDANFLALVDPRSGQVDTVVLPRGDGGLRQFDDARGNKASKLDLEACIVVDDHGVPALLAFGSGATDRRERVIRVRGLGGEDPEVDVLDAAKFYAALRATAGFAPGQMNLEGVIALPNGDLCFASRGNGAGADGARPVNGFAMVDREALLAHLDAPEWKEMPSIGEVFQLDLGTLDGVPLGVTDGIATSAGILLSAAAEASPNAVDDGPVTGSAIALIGVDGTTRWAPVVEADGALARVKVEGILLAGGVMYGVVDDDDPAAPSTLLTLRFDASA